MLKLGCPARRIENKAQDGLKRLSRKNNKSHLYK